MHKAVRKALFPLLLATGIATAPKAQAQDEGKVVLANALIHAVVGGAGAAAHHQDLFEGFAKGFAGGTLVGVGKYWVGANVNGAWGAKMLTSIGTSVTYNTAAGRDPFAMIMMDIGPVMLTYDSAKGFKPYLLPKAGYDLLRTIADGYHFDLEESLRRGTPMFDGGYMPSVHGFARSNVLVVEDHDPRLTQATRHELVHAHQYLQSFIFEPLLRGISPVDDVMSFTEKYHVKLDYLNFGLTQLQVHLWNHDERPIELEAGILAKPTPDRDLLP